MLFLDVSLAAAVSRTAKTLVSRGRIFPLTSFLTYRVNTALPIIKQRFQAIQLAESLGVWIDQYDIRNTIVIGEMMRTIRHMPE